MSLKYKRKIIKFNANDFNRNIKPNNNIFYTNEKTKSNNKYNTNNNNNS